MSDPDERIAEIYQHLRTIGTPDDELATLGRSQLRSELGDEQYEAWISASVKPFRRAGRVARARRTSEEARAKIVSVSARDYRRDLRSIHRIQEGRPIDVLLGDHTDGSWTARISGGPTSPKRAMVRQAIDDLIADLAERTKTTPADLTARIDARVVTSERGRNATRKTPSV